MCPACRANLVTSRTSQQRNSGQTMLCSRCGARLSKNAPVCCNCGVLEPKPKRPIFRPAMLAVTAALAVLVVAIGARFGRTPALDAASTTTAVTNPNAVPNATALTSTPAVQAATPTRSERGGPPPATVRRWTATWVNVREGRGVENAVVTTLDPGVAVDVHDRQGAWWAVVDAGRHLGYVANSVLLPEPPDAVAPEMEPPLVSRRSGR